MNKSSKSSLFKKLKTIIDWKATYTSQIIHAIHTYKRQNQG
jgi:hypothetical protein